MSGQRINTQRITSGNAQHRYVPCTYDSADHFVVTANGGMFNLKLKYDGTLSTIAGGYGALTNNIANCSIPSYAKSVMWYIQVNWVAANSGNAFSIGEFGKSYQGIAAFGASVVNYYTSCGGSVAKSSEGFWTLYLSNAAGNHVCYARVLGWYI